MQGLVPKSKPEMARDHIMDLLFYLLDEQLNEVHLLPRQDLTRVGSRTMQVFYTCCRSEGSAPVAQVLVDK